MQEIRIKVEQNKKIITLIDNYHVVEKYEMNSSENIEGNIYLGVIKNIVPGINAAFVDIGKEKNAFIHFDDLYKTNKEIKLNEKILVQVQKNPINQKGAKLTTNIKLTGRQIVLMPKADFVTASRKITDEIKKEELKNFVEKNIPQGFGAIIRTGCTIADKQEILDDIKRLLEKWDNINKQIATSKDDSPCILDENNNIVKSLILGTTDVNKIITNNKNENEKILKFLKEYNLENKIDIIYDADVFDQYSIQKELEELNNNKVWLKCGGYIVIDKTEALTAIDVNSGKCVGRYNLDETVLKVNKEATKEIAKQIRLRDIGGIIVVDYIDMLEESNRNDIINLFLEEVQKDRAKVQIEGFTKLNLLELTRKKMY